MKELYSNLPHFEYDREKKDLKFVRFLDGSSREVEDDISYTGAWGIEYDLSRNSFWRTYLNSARRRYVLYGGGRVRVLPSPPDKAYRIAYGSEVLSFDGAVRLTNGYEFSTNISDVGPNNGCYGNLLVDVYPSLKLSSVTFKGVCKVYDDEIADYVLEDPRIKCNKYRDIDGNEVYSCRVSFQPRRLDPERVCNELRGSYYFNVRSCSKKGKKVELNLFFPASSLEDVNTVSGADYEPDEYVRNAIVDELISADAVGDYLKEYFKDFEVFISYLEGDNYPFELRAYVDISSGDVPVSDLPKYLEEIM